MALKCIFCFASKQAHKKDTVENRLKYNAPNKRVKKVSGALLRRNMKIVETINPTTLNINLNGRNIERSSAHLLVFAETLCKKIVPIPMLKMISKRLPTASANVYIPNPSGPYTLAMVMVRMKVINLIATSATRRYEKFFLTRLSASFTLLNDF